MLTRRTPHWFGGGHDYVGAFLGTVVVAEFGDMYPELREKEAFVIEIIKEEEEAFSSMLVREGPVFFSWEVVLPCVAGTGAWR